MKVIEELFPLLFDWLLTEAILEGPSGSGIKVLIFFFNLNFLLA